MPRPFDLKTILSPIQDIIHKLDKRRSSLREELEEIESTLTRFCGRTRGRRQSADTGSGMANGASAAPPGRKRVRRYRAAIEHEALKIIEFIKSFGANGATAGEIKSRFHIPSPSFKAYLKQYTPRGSFKTTGAKSKMRYFGA